MNKDQWSLILGLLEHLIDFLSFCIFSFLYVINNDNAPYLSFIIIINNINKKIWFLLLLKYIDNYKKFYIKIKKVSIVYSKTKLNKGTKIVSIHNNL